MYQVIYVSASTDTISKARLSSILVQSRRDNIARHVTGMLFSYRDSYLQVLEGEERTVRELTGVIAADRRHTAFTLLVATPVAEKLFGQWSMGYVDADTARDLVKQYVTEDTDHALMSLTAANALQMLDFFKRVVGDDLP